MEDEELCIERLRLAIIEGENSGLARTYDMKAFINAKLDNLRDECPPATAECR